jgi:hypothetical protein
MPRSCAEWAFAAYSLVETRLALRLREELLLSTTNELLDLVAAVRERRRRGRGRVLHWPGTAPTETLTNELEEIAYRLSAAGDPFTSPL